MVHMKEFPLDGDNERKEVSLFVVPVSVKGEHQEKGQIKKQNCPSCGNHVLSNNSKQTTASPSTSLGVRASTASRTS